MDCLSITWDEILLNLVLCGLDSLCSFFEHLSNAVVLLVLHILWVGVRPECLLVCKFEGGVPFCYVELPLIATFARIGDNQF